MNKLSAAVAGMILIAGVSAQAQVPGTTDPAPTVQIQHGKSGKETGRNVTINRDVYRALRDSINRIDQAVAGGRLEAPVALPAGKGTLTGYIRTDVPDFFGAVVTNYLIGHLAVIADFGQGTVKTFAGNFYRFNTHHNRRVFGWNGRGRFYGTLSGSGTISRTEIRSNLLGALEGNSPNHIVVDADLEGRVSNNGGATLVHGGVTGTYISVKRNRDRTELISRSRTADITSGKFFATNKRDNSAPGMVLIASKGPGARATISRATYLRQVDAFSLFDTAVEAGRLEAPRTLPAGRGVLTGYIKTDYFTSSEYIYGSRNYILGRLAVDADFDSGTVTTTAGNFREFAAGRPGDGLDNYFFANGVDTTGEHWQQSVWSGRGEPTNGWDGRGRIYGTLSGDGTIAAGPGGFTSSLNGKLSDGRIGDIDVDADMTGQLHRNGNGDKLVLLGAVTGTYTPASENSLKGKKRGAKQVARITDGSSPGSLAINNGKFFAIERSKDIASGLERLGTPRGAGQGATIRPFQHLQRIDNLAFINAAVENGRLEAPDTLPVGTGTLTGYVKADNLFSDRRVIGNLTIEADFGAGTVTTSASDFRQFRRGDLSGQLAGSGTITATEIDSTLNGVITLDDDGTTTTTLVGGSMDGNVYDNDGSLLVHGGLTGSFTTDGSATDIAGGAFYAVQN
ncbi:MAG: hypothetical protein GDA49_05580 [Rhodospirillales bacterium]|nr:hypothetical protein [Rhodospirillales bacterium]